MTPLIPVLPSKIARAWPEHPEGARAEYLELPTALAQRYRTDAHLAGYSVPAVARRLARGAPEKLSEGVRMVLAVFDVDGAGHAASDAWREAERVKVAELQAGHPGVVMYETRGGYRLVATLPTPVIIRSDVDRAAWRRLYLHSCAFLSRRWAIVADPACSDWSRLYRLPHATRDEGGRPEELPVVGDVAAIGSWTYVPIGADALADVDEARRLAGLYPAWAAAVKHIAPSPPRPRSAPASAVPARQGERADRYAGAALELELDRVRSAAEGTRNAVLNEAAYSLGQLVGAGALQRPDVERELEVAGRDAGLNESEILDTIKSGLDAGEKAPRELPAAGRRIGANEIRAARHGVGALPEDETDDPGPAATEPPCRAGSLLEIRLGPDEARVVDSAIRALARDESVFQRDGRLVRIQDDAQTIPKIRPLPLASLRERLATVAEFQQRKGSGDDAAWVRVHPPEWVTKAVDARGSWHGIRPLRGAITAPAMRPNGSIISAPGYDSSTGLLFVPRTEFPAVPSSPTGDQVRAAVEALTDPLCDFPLVDQADRAACLALVLSIAGRPAIDGPVPLFAFRANTRGTGKGLLCDVLVTAAMGRPAKLIPSPPEDNTEWRKLILSLAMEAPVAVCIDNVEGALGSAALAAALTSSEVSDRVLGTNQTGGGEIRLLWTATGNNLTLRRDLDRRVVMISQETVHEAPEDRTDFRYPDLMGHVRSVWPQLVTAALTILRAYHVAGRPAHGKPALGRFEAWDRLARGALIWAGAGDPDGARARTREESDGDRDAHLTAMTAWLEAFGGTHKTTAEACLAALGERAERGDPELEAALSGIVRGPLSPKSLGYALRKLRRTVRGGVRFDMDVGRARERRWHVEHVGATDGGRPNGVDGAHGDDRFPLPWETNATYSRARAHANGPKASSPSAPSTPSREPGEDDEDSQGELALGPAGWPHGGQGGTA